MLHYSLLSIIEGIDELCPIYKYSKKTSKIERENLHNVTLSFSTLNVVESSEDTVKLVEE